MLQCLNRQAVARQQVSDVNLHAGSWTLQRLQQNHTSSLSSDADRHETQHQNVSELVPDMTGFGSQLYPVEKYCKNYAEVGMMKRFIAEGAWCTFPIRWFEKLQMLSLRECLLAAGPGRCVRK